MKITDVRAQLLKPTPDSSEWFGSWLLVFVDTDEGVTGMGEASNTPGAGSFILADALDRVKDSVVGEDPADIDRLWNKLFRRFSYMGSRGMATCLISGIDIALWDIKGKTLGRPIYDLLGGRFRDGVPLYANTWFRGCQSPEDYALAAKHVVELGYTAMKMDPFLEMRPHHSAVEGAIGPEEPSGYVNGVISPQGEQQGLDITAAVREAVGPHVDILIDAHGHYNVASAIRIGRRLEPYNIGWYEEPVPPESLTALKQVRDSVNVPISVGERLFGRFDVAPIVESRLADYVMQDVCWSGGISEMRKTAHMLETHYVPISPHTVLGPVQLLAAAHAVMTVPNLYRVEFSLSGLETYNQMLDKPLDIRDGVLHLPEAPGLGYGLNDDFIKSHAIERR